MVTSIRRINIIFSGKNTLPVNFSQIFVVWFKFYTWTWELWAYSFFLFSFFAFNPLTNTSKMCNLFSFIFSWICTDCFGEGFIYRFIRNNTRRGRRSVKKGTSIAQCGTSISRVDKNQKTLATAHRNRTDRVEYNSAKFLVLRVFSWTFYSEKVYAYPEWTLSAPVWWI